MSRLTGINATIIIWKNVGRFRLEVLGYVMNKVMNDFGFQRRLSKIVNNKIKDIKRG